MNKNPILEKINGSSYRLNRVSRRKKGLFGAPLTTAELISSKLEKTPPFKPFVSK